MCLDLERTKDGLWLVGLQSLSDLGALLEGLDIGLLRGPQLECYPMSLPWRYHHTC